MLQWCQNVLSDGWSLCVEWVLVSWNYLNLLKVFIFKQHLWFAKRKTNWHVAGNVGYCPILPLSAIRHLRPPQFGVWIVLTQNLLMLAVSLTVHLALKSSSFERRILNWGRYKNSCSVKDVLLTFDNFHLLRTSKWGCTLSVTYFNNMATAHNRLWVVEELSSPAFCKFLAPISPKRE
jgi:hypothetical protein